LGDCVEDVGTAVVVETAPAGRESQALVAHRGRPHAIVVASGHATNPFPYPSLPYAHSRFFADIAVGVVAELFCSARFKTSADVIV